jgi:hypothetical protein
MQKIVKVFSKSTRSACRPDEDEFDATGMSEEKIEEEARNLAFENFEWWYIVELVNNK